MNIAYKVPVIESERGWGAKVEDYMICISHDEAKLFIKEFNAENDEPTAPDWYMQAEDTIIDTELSETQMDILIGNGGRMWWSKLKHYLERVKS